jgi:hypothetical protein
MTTDLAPPPIRPTRPDPLAADPPDEPPPGVTAELLWRVAIRLYRDHGAVLACDHDHAEGPREHCRRCRQPWPCSGRRLAELALISAVP